METGGGESEDSGDSQPSIPAVGGQSLTGPLGFAVAKQILPEFKGWKK